MTNFAPSPTAEQARRELERRQAAQAERARRELARRHLIDFARLVDPAFQTAPHLDLIAGYLERARRREIRRLMIFAPPRHGKSRLTSEIFPAWALGIDPGEQFMVCSHTQNLADTFSRNVRNTIGSELYAGVFDKTRLSDDNATIQKWTLAGFARPAMMAVGVGGSPTGHGAKILVIDDPISNAEDAESALQREAIYRWYVDTIYPRLEPNAVIILMMQRWHEDDLAGRLLRDQDKADRWEVVNLRALAEADDPLARPAGAALWPARYDTKALAQIRAVSQRSFEAKYQQRPRPAEGAMFKRGWLRVVDGCPAGLRWARYYDLAYSTKQAADNTATIAGALGKDGVLYLRRGRAGKLESPDARKLITELMLNEPETRHGVEAKIHGAPIVQDLRRETRVAHVALAAVEIHNDKMVRAAPVADRAEAGKVAFVRESVNDDGWIRDWLDEMCAFPFGAHDDRADAVSGVNQMLAKSVQIVWGD